jgi:hypothetical protein
LKCASSFARQDARWDSIVEVDDELIGVLRGVNFCSLYKEKASFC